MKPLPKLGCLPSLHDHRTFKLESFLTGILPQVKPSVCWSGKMKPITMMANDRMGNCTCASAGHMVQSWTANESSQVILPDSDIIKAYSAVSGYNPKTGANDNGAVLMDVLKLWRNKGIGGHKVKAFVSINPRNHDHIKLAIDLFGGVYMAVGLPLSAQGKTSWDSPANTTGRNRPRSWGGHAIPSVTYNSRYCPVITWGMEIDMTWDFWDAYGEECYAIISTDWITDGQSPSGFDMNRLEKALAAL